MIENAHFNNVIHITIMCTSSNQIQLMNELECFAVKLAIVKRFNSYKRKFDHFFFNDTVPLIYRK